MYNQKTLYFSVLAGSLLFPFLLSFVKGVSYYKNWKNLLITHFTIAVFFCIWDSIFTKLGVWGFNEKYISGLHIGNLPIEEVLFFIVIPYCCLFIYESLTFHFKITFNTKKISIAVGVLSFVLAIYNYDKLYTSISLIICALLCILLYIKNYSWLATFLVAFAISMIPFLIVNGILTGGFTSEPVVWYNDAENLGIRIGTIPIEDISYGFDMLLMNVILYEYLKGREKI
jgi:lycopene cyclase domain-containing protein